MANFNDLVRAIAAVEGMDEMTVVGIGQYARDAGHISKSGRGRSAAGMTPRDAANLLIGVNATGKAKDAAQAIEVYRALVMTEDTADYMRRFTSADIEIDDLWLETLPAGASFGSALEALIEASMPRDGREPVLVESRNGPDRVTLSIEFARPHPEVRIFGEDAPGHGRVFDGEELPQPVVHARFQSPGSAQGSLGDRRDRTSISSATLLAVGRALAV